MPIDENTAARIQANIANDLWAKDANLDLRGFLIPQKHTDDGTDPFREGSWANLSEEGTGPASARLKAFLNSRDAKIALADFSPEAASRFLDEQSEEAAVDFIKATPSYHATTENYDTLVGWLAQKYLGKSHLETEDAQQELTRRGQFTSLTLAEAFKALTRSGHLKRKPGQLKNLTPFEENQVVAAIRSSGPAQGISAYLEFAFGGASPDASTVEEVMAEHPALMSAASVFVWQHFRGVLDEEFRPFANGMLRQQRLLTFSLIDELYAKWEKKKTRSALFDAVPTQANEPTRESLEDLSDTDIEDLLKRTLIDRARKR